MNTSFIIVFGGLLLLLGVISFSVYKATDPHILEAKEVRGMLEETENLANEAPQVMRSFGEGSIPATFYTIHIDEIQKEVHDVESGFASSEFDMTVPIQKQQAITLLRSLEDQIENNKDKPENVQANVFRSLSDQLRALKENI